MIVAGGAIVTASGLLWRRPLLQQFAIGASVAIAAVPEGLPLLAGTGEAAVARRLAGRQALVRRPSAVETLGRVDVTCADKTETLTEGRLVLSLVADFEKEATVQGELPDELRRVLLTAALASPHPDAPDFTKSRRSTGL
jgi:cation-transporting ATPase I